MAAVGFEMYTRMLAEAVDMLRGRRPAPEPSPIRLDLPGSAFLPDDYIADSGGKLEAYRRFAHLRFEADADALRVELRDRYGPIPPPVEGLFTAVRVRLAAEAAGVPEVRVEDRKVTLKWAKLPDRRAVSIALQAAGLRPDTASNQVRIPVIAGRDAVDVALRALTALVEAQSGVA
jgi:transcription-repair coupling factor (superfamily II helicase)